MFREAGKGRTNSWRNVNRGGILRFSRRIRIGAEVIVVCCSRRKVGLHVHSQLPSSTTRSRRTRNTSTTISSSPEGHSTFAPAAPSETECAATTSLGVSLIPTFWPEVQFTTNISSSRVSEVRSRRRSSQCTFNISNQVTRCLPGMVS